MEYKAKQPPKNVLQTAMALLNMARKLYEEEDACLFSDFSTSINGDYIAEFYEIPGKNFPSNDGKVCVNIRKWGEDAVYKVKV